MSVTPALSPPAPTVFAKCLAQLRSQRVADNENQVRRFVVGAHYDVAGEQAGEDDNASGVAGLIELAKALSNAKLKQRVEIVAYTLEEPPYFVAQIWAAPFTPNH